VPFGHILNASGCLKSARSAPFLFAGIKITKTSQKKVSPTGSNSNFKNFWGPMLQKDQ
jgi:hypothetical protein